MKEKSFFSRLFGGGAEAQHGDEKKAAETTPIQTDTPFRPFPTQEIRDQKAEAYQWACFELGNAFFENASSMIGNPAINRSAAMEFMRACRFAKILLDHERLEKAKRENATQSLFKIFVTLGEKGGTK